MNAARVVPPAAIFAFATAAAATVVGIAVQREIAIGTSGVAAADDAIARLDWPAAIDESRAAAEARAPWSPWPERGAGRLETIARAAEARGDAATALLAYGALRSASLATQGAGPGEARWLDVADEGLARISTAGDDSARARDRASSIVRELRHSSGPGAGSIAALALAGLAVLIALGSLATGRRVVLGRALLAGGFVLFAIVLLMN